MSPESPIEKFKKIWKYYKKNIKEWLKQQEITPLKVLEVLQLLIMCLQSLSNVKRNVH